MAEKDEAEAAGDLERKFYQTMIWYFELRPTGFYNQLGLLKDQLIDLNQHLRESGTASDAVARALNRLTLVGVVVAGLGVLVAAGNLWLEILKYTSGKG